MTDYEEQLPDDEKVRIVSNFICNAPPGEFKEVLTDVRSLLNNDTLLKEQASGVFSQYSKDQLTPVNIEGSEYPTLITKFNDLGGGRFVDPRTQQSFKYDPLREEASQLQEHPVNLELEGWRSSLEATWTIYCKEHYRDGANAVFANLTENGHISLSACIEDHQLQPKNFWNGRWRSVWTITFNPNALGQKCSLEGAVKVQVHYYEDGNVQLVSSKDIAESVVVNNETQLANDFVKTVENAENEYQNAISENYQTMSDVTFKALRRPLPLTRSKIEWSNMKGYRIGSELKQQ